MDWSSRRIPQQRQGSNHFLHNNHLNESAPRRGYMVPETAEREPFTNHHPRFPYQLNLQNNNNPFPNHYPLHHPQDMTCSRILREMEKEKIREEIIMSEVARRRGLEAEVRYELMLEQQNNHGSRDVISPSRLPLTTRKPLEEKTVMSRDRSKSQCENDLLRMDLRTSEEVKPPPFLLPKPADQNLSGSKRKAPETPQGADTSEPLLQKGCCSKIKAKEAWSCALCLFSSTSKQGLEEHLDGEQHKANEDALRSESARKNHGAELLAKKETIESIQIVSAKAASPLKKNETEEALESLQESVEPEGPKKDEREGDSRGVMENDKGYKFWCEICGVGTFSQKVMNTHKAGRKHTRQVQSRDRTGWSFSAKNAAVPPANNGESAAAEDGSKCAVVSESEADAIREDDDDDKQLKDDVAAVMKPVPEDDDVTDLNGEDEIGAIGCDLVDDIKEEDWWAYMDVANAEIDDDAVKL